jgi:adenosylmethionine-8-amino-7-oxononanoate aminotransferase
MVCQFMEDLSQRDRQCLWHPFTQALLGSPPLPFYRGKGAYLYSAEDEAYLDAFSSWWVNLHGHSHPEIVAAISEQAALLDHAPFTDFTHLPAVNYAENLLACLGKPYSRVFYTDNGSTAVECAIKMALQYWHNQGIQKDAIISFKGGYHGDTFGAMSASGKNFFNVPFWPFLFQVNTLSFPFDEEESLTEMRRLCVKQKIACFIFEPLILGAGGMKIYSQQCLEKFLKFCKSQEILTIADEVMTGYGRTGPLFACNLLETKPDMICLSKGITGGFLPLGATVCTEAIYNAFLSSQKTKTFLHGHSYCGNPIACNAAIASLNLLLKDSCTHARKKIHLLHKNFCEKWKDHPRLLRLETLGTILVVEYASKLQGYTSPIGEALTQHFLSKKILVRPLGNVLYILPPYCIDEEALHHIYQEIAHTLEDPLWNY